MTDSGAPGDVRTYRRSVCEPENGSFGCFSYLPDTIRSEAGTRGVFSSVSSLVTTGTVSPGPAPRVRRSVWGRQRARKLPSPPSSVRSRPLRPPLTPRRSRSGASTVIAHSPSGATAPKVRQRHDSRGIWFSGDAAVELSVERAVDAVTVGARSSAVFALRLPADASRRRFAGANLLVFLPYRLTL